MISELAFSRRGAIVPHSNPNLTFFIVISGGGFVQVGEERTRVNHGEAIVWPADIPHGAYTEGTEMRAIVVELPESMAPAGLLEGRAEVVARKRIEAAEGALAGRQVNRGEYDTSEGEPW